MNLNFFSSITGATNILENAILFIAGQSNVVTLNSGPPDVELQGPISDCLILRNGGNYSILDYGVSQNGTGENNFQDHGIELRLGTLLPKPAILGKKGHSATSLAVDWADGSTLRNGLIDNLNTLITDYPDREIYFIWNQWESDAADTARANAYYTNLKAFLLDIQANSKPFKRILIIQANLEATGAPDPETTTIINAQIQVSSELANVFIVPTTGVIYNDGFHWNSAFIDTMAYRVYNALSN